MEMVWTLAGRSFCLFSCQHLEGVQEQFLGLEMPEE